MTTCAQCDALITAACKSGLCKRHLSQKWRAEHPDRTRELWEQHYADPSNFQKAKDRHKKYHAANKIKQNAKSRIYYAEHKTEIIAYQKVNYKKRLKTDPIFKLRVAIRRRLNNVGICKKFRPDYEELVGCTLDELKIYLEKQFYPNSETAEQMGWHNHTTNGWHIDHIEPLIKFDLLDQEQLKKACHYTNLQPLWKKDHLCKTALENAELFPLPLHPSGNQ
jgi:hypothetical protein